MKTKSKLIDKIAIFADFRGNPSDPNDLYEYFNQSGKIYNALALGGGKPLWQSHFESANNDVRAVYYAALAHAACSLIVHKTGQDVNQMEPLELTAALHGITETDTPTRYKRRRTGRNNKMTDKRITTLFEQAYDSLMAAKPARLPGRKPLLDKARRLCRQNPRLKGLTDKVTDHHAREFLKQKKS